jgi:hypothetical protein
MSCNKIVQINECINIPDSLKELNISENNLQHIPTKIQNNTKLTLSHDQNKKIDDKSSHLLDKNFSDYYSKYHESKHTTHYNYHDNYSNSHNGQSNHYNNYNNYNNNNYNNNYGNTNYSYRSPHPVKETKAVQTNPLYVSHNKRNHYII